jgi:phage terminase Nu1 subunit (DNA packaging protein)
MALTGITQIANVLNLTERRVQQLVREGLPKEGHGQYDLAKSMMWYIRYLQKKVEARATESEAGAASSWRDEKKRLLHLQANNEELEYKRKLGEVVPVEMVRDQFVTFATTVHDRLIALPSKIAPRLEGESREVIRVKLHEFIKDTLNGLSAEPIYHPKPIAEPEPIPEIQAEEPKVQRRKNARTVPEDSGGKPQRNHASRGGKVRGRA